ncbi:MAG TPA: HAD-IIIA family hydrolase [Stellaceae bacterium]
MIAAILPGPGGGVEIGGETLRSRQFRALAKGGVRAVAALTPADAAAGDNLAMHGLSLLDPAAALAQAEEGLLLVAPDLLFDVDLARFQAAHRAAGAGLTVLAQPADAPGEADLLLVRDGDAVSAVLPRRGVRPDGDRRNIAAAGLCLATPAAAARYLSGSRAAALSSSLADILVAALADGVAVAAYRSPEYCRSAIAPEQRARAERDLRAGLVEARRLGHRRPAVFFDCDGVLNQEPGPQGTLSPDDVVLAPGAGRAVARVNEAGYLAIGVTNRAQVAKGRITLEGLDAVLGRLETLLAQDGGGVLDRIYFCPHYPPPGPPGSVPALTVACDCRKPRAGMLRRAAEELPVDPARTVMVGDTLRDVGAARAFGIPAYGVRTGHGCRDDAAMPGLAPDRLFDSVVDAVDFILSSGPR